MKQKLLHALVRAIGSVCILAALAALFLPACVKIDGVPRKELRAISETLETGLADVEEFLLDYYSSPDIKEDLKDNDLPSTKSSIKSRIQTTATLIDALINTDITINELLMLSLEAPRYIEDTANLLETDIVVNQLYLMADESIEDGLEDAVDTLSDISILFVVFSGLLIFIVAVGGISAITHCCNKLRGFKYLFLVIVIGITVGLTVGLPMVNSMIYAAVDLPVEFEDLALKVTIMPYLATALAIVPVVLDIIFERKFKTAKVEG